MRVELTFSASYDAPTETVKQALGEVLAQFPQILEDPAPSIWISKYGASSIEYVVRVWTAAGDYWDVYYGVMEGVRPAFQRHGIQMTYDHLNVHLLEK
jgi:small conductance mechanosensitive channel